MTLPSLVIVSGPPASGKTTLAYSLARHLGMPLLAKDIIKERIADTLGPAAIELSDRIGLAAILTVYDTAREILEAGQSVVLESFFHHGKAEQDLGPLVAMSHAILLHCTSDQDVLLRRYAERMSSPNRHIVHGDAHRLDDLRGYLNNDTTDPLDLPIPRLILDTTVRFPELAEVARQVHLVLENQHENLASNA